MIVESFQWVQCEDVLCGKWRRLYSKDYEPSLDGWALSSQLTATTIALKNKMKKEAFSKNPWRPMTLEDLTKGSFYCWMNPDEQYARCTVPEEQMDETEVVL